jgi:hypothetical protein
VSTSPSWSLRRARVLPLGLIILAFSGCGSLLTFTPERAAVEVLLGPPETTGRTENITPGSVKVAQTQDWREGYMVAVTFNATEPQTGLLDCLYIFEATRAQSRWVAYPQERDCGPAGGNGEAYQQLQSQMWGTDIPGMSIAYGLVYDTNIHTLDILWEDGERETIAVINGTYIWVREGVHDAVLVRPLDENGDLIK